MGGSGLLGSRPLQREHRPSPRVRQYRERFSLGAQLAICARVKAVEAIKAVKAKRRETCPSLARAAVCATMPAPTL